MKKAIEQVELAKQELRTRFLNAAKDGGLSKERYVRFLRAQFHLTKGVQRTFFAIAANSLMARKRSLRNWLINFAQEEESHFELAKADLKELGQEPGVCPLDVKLWWLYYESIVQERPFVRLGATCVLENIGNGSSDVIDGMIKESTFLNPKNLRFLIVHKHGPNLDHGNQIYEALEAAELSEEQLADVVEGTKTATTLYLRIFDWILSGKPAA